MKTAKQKCLILLISMLVPMISVAFSGCNAKGEVSNTTQEQATVQTTIQQTAQAETKPTVAETTQAPKPDYHEAYQAYKEKLKDRSAEIKAYDWQIDDSESKPVVFADVLGNETPEMIIAFMDADDPTSFGYYIRCEIYTYKDGECKLAYTDSDDVSHLDYASQFYHQYLFFQVNDSKDLYWLDYRGVSFTRNNNIYRMDWDGENLNPKLICEQTYSDMPDVYERPDEKSGIVEGEDVGYENSEIYKYNLLDSMSHILMYNDHSFVIFDTDYQLADRNEAMSYQDAVSYLDKKLS